MAEKNLKKGIFITFEGPEGCGKSTHSGLIAEFLKKEGYNVVYTREPGGTLFGDKIREVLLHSKKIEISPLAEVLLFEASRLELVRRVIKPALCAKKIIISDRFNDTTLVYQGYAGNVRTEIIRKVESLSVAGIKPDLTILLDINVKKGLRRTSRGGKDRIESKKLSFHKKVKAGYLKLAGRDRKRIKIVKTKDRIENTFEAVKKEVINVVRRYKRSG